uniref:SEA domain-containing protein n=1 Tax=Malurus cyaneus samueli TaxID=2593467 RepID=A0A8C5TU92_9PASS
QTSGMGHTELSLQGYWSDDGSIRLPFHWCPVHGGQTSILMSLSLIETLFCQAQLHTLAFASLYSTSVLLPAPSTTAAALEHFTVNFTITNLPYTSDLKNPDSAKFRSTRRVMNTMLDRLLKGSSIGPVFQGCETTDFRPGSDRDQTRVDAVCTYSKEPSGAPLDRVGLYQHVSNKTRGISQLGPYSLDRNSLYVNGERRSLLGLLCCAMAALGQRCPLASSAADPLSLSFPRLQRTARADQ